MKLELSSFYVDMNITIFGLEIISSSQEQLMRMTIVSMRSRVTLMKTLKRTLHNQNLKHYGKAVITS